MQDGTSFERQIRLKKGAATPAGIFALYSCYNIRVARNVWGLRAEHLHSLFPPINHHI